jgi:hypothetical protein
MAVITLDVNQEIKDIGTGITSLATFCSVSAALTMNFRNDGNLILVIHNAQAAATATATLVSQRDPYGRGGSADPNNDEVIVIPAVSFGCFFFANPNMFNLGAVATVTMDVVTTVTVGLIRLTKVF